MIGRIFNCANAYMRLRGLNRRTESLIERPQELVAECFTYAGAFLQPVQVPEEMISLIAQVRKLNPQDRA